MRKFLLLGILAVLAVFVSLKSQANPLDVPTGGGRIAAPIAATANGYFVGTTTFTVVLATPTVNFQYCISHLVVSTLGSGSFELVWASAPMNVSSIAPITGTTDYVVNVSSATYDTQWAYRTPYCAPVNDLLTLYMGALPAVSTVTYEGYTWSGWNQP